MRPTLAAEMAGMGLTGLRIPEHRQPARPAAARRHRAGDRRRDRAGLQARHRPDPARPRLRPVGAAIFGKVGDVGKLDNKVAIVTGAGQGIGRAIAEKLAAEGATVVVTDINESTAKETAVAIGGEAVGMHTDVTSHESVDVMVAQVKRRFGRIDVLVNNAGWDKASPFLDSDPTDWDRVIQINLYGVLNTSKAVLPIMAEQGSGSVVNLGSDAGRVGSSGEAVYSAAKGAVIAFTKATAREMARYQVNINCVCPGPTDTALFASVVGDTPKLRSALTKAIPFRRLAWPSDLANAVAFYASDEAGFITGQTVSVSGGLTMS